MGGGPQPRSRRYPRIALSKGMLVSQQVRIKHVVSTGTTLGLGGVVDDADIPLGDHLCSASPAKVRLAETTLAAIRVSRCHRAGRRVPHPRHWLTLAKLVCAMRQSTEHGLVATRIQSFARRIRSDDRIRLQNKAWSPWNHPRTTGGHSRHGIAAKNESAAVQVQAFLQLRTGEYRDYPDQ